MADGAKLGQQAITIPDGGTSSRPGTPASGMVRLNTDLFTAEIYQDNGWVPFASKQDGTTSAKAISSTANLAVTYSTFGYSGQNRLYIKNNSGTAVETDTYKDANGSVWYLICGIGDGTGSTSYSSWYNNNAWRGSTTFGTLNTANLQYKNSLYYDSTYTDLLIMQGHSNSTSLYTDWYGNCAEVAYTGSQWLSSRGSKLSSFLSGTNGPDVGTNGASNRTIISGVTFLKGSASQSIGYFYGNTQGELSANNTLDFGGQNNEGYRYSMCAALGCQNNGVNAEHQCWAADTAMNYESRNMPGTNYGSPYGPTTSYNHYFWLIWAKT